MNIFFLLFLIAERSVHIAAQKNYIEILRHLVYVGADINAGVSWLFL